MANGPSHSDAYFFGTRPTVDGTFRLIDDHLARGGSLSDHEVRSAVYHRFFDATVPDLTSLPSDDMHLVFGPSAVAGHDVHSIVSRAALHSARAYFVTPYTMKRTVFPDPYDDVFSETYSLDISGEFVRLALELKPYIIDGCIQIVPMTSTYDAFGDRAFTNAEHSHLLGVLLDDELSGALATESAAAVEIPLQAVQAPGERVLDIRSEYYESFRNVQRGVLGLVSTRPEDGERALSESMWALGEEVRRLNEEMEQLRRKPWFESMNLALTPFPVLLPILLPQPLGTVVDVALNVLGGGGVLEYVRHLSERRKALGRVKGDVFYIPWLLREAPQGNVHLRQAGPD